MNKTMQSITQKSNKLQVRDEKLLQVFEKIIKSISEVDDIKELQNIRNMADGFEQAWQGYYHSSGFGLDQMFLGWETKVRSEKRMGELLKSMELNKKFRGNQYANLQDEIKQLKDLGISEIQSFRYQKLADILDEKFDKMIEALRLQFKEPTTAALLSKAHVSYSAGEEEWYTPKEYIEAARSAMGSIDLDPASCKKANEIVKAKKYFTKEDNGLIQTWNGNVWLNPPYSYPGIEDFSNKVINELGNTKQVCILVNNATETKWFQKLLKRCVAVCFPKGRVRFWNEKGEAMTSPLQGQAILYFGKKPEAFDYYFRNFGEVLWQRK